MVPKPASDPGLYPSGPAWARASSAAAAECRRPTSVTSAEHLARIEDPQGVDGFLDHRLQQAGALIEFADQPMPLEAADPVLTGDGPAEVESELHDLGEGFLRLGDTGRVGGVEEHARVHIPVPG